MSGVKTFLNLIVNKTGSDKCVGIGRKSPRSNYKLMPTTLLCATQIHSGDTRTYVSARELAAPTTPMGKIGILITVVTVIQTLNQNSE